MDDKELFERFRDADGPFEQVIWKARDPLTRLFREVRAFSLALVENLDGLTASFAKMYGLDETGALAVKGMLAETLRNAAERSLQEAPRKVRREALRDYQKGK